jgi:hypothetical protein
MNKQEDVPSEEKHIVKQALNLILDNMIFLLPLIICLIAQPAMAEEVKQQVIKNVQKTKKAVKYGTTKVLENSSSILQKNIIKAHKDLNIRSISKDFNTIYLEDGGKIFNALKSKEHQEIVKHAIECSKQKGSVFDVLSQKQHNLMSLDLLKLVASILE